MQNKDKSQNSPNPGANYETRDANIPAIAFFGICIVILCVVGFLWVRRLVRDFEHHAEKTDQLAAQSQVAPNVSRAQPYFPLPREQPSPPEELATFRARELVELSSYGWIDRKDGVVRVPIDRAMELLLQRGVRTRSTTNEATSSSGILQLQQARAQSVTPSTREIQP